MTDVPETEYIRVDPETVAYLPGNPNEMPPEDFSKLCGGIERLGFLQSITVRAVNDELRDRFPGQITPAHEYVVIDGEHRLRAAIQLHLREIPAVLASHDQAEAVLAQISMNKLRGQLDVTRVGKNLESLTNEGWEISELELSGFAEDEIRSLLDALSTDEVNDLMDDSSAPPDLDERPQRFMLSFNCGSDVLRAKIRARLLELAGDDGSLLEGLLAALDLD